MPRECSISSRHTRTAPLFSPAAVFVCFLCSTCPADVDKGKGEGRVSAQSGKHAHKLSAHKDVHVRSYNEYTHEPRLSDKNLAHYGTVWGSAVGSMCKKVGEEEEEEEEKQQGLVGVTQ